MAPTNSSALVLSNKSELEFQWDNEFTFFLVIGCFGVGFILLEIGR